MGVCPPAKERGDQGAEEQTANSPILHRPLPLGRPLSPAVPSCPVLTYCNPPTHTHTPRASAT